MSRKQQRPHYFFNLFAKSRPKGIDTNERRTRDPKELLIAIFILGGLILSSMTPRIITDAREMKDLRLSFNFMNLHTKNEMRKPGNKVKRPMIRQYIITILLFPSNKF